MKKKYLIIIGVLLLILLWSIYTFEFINLFNKRKIKLNNEVTQEINDHIVERNIVRPIQKTTLIIYKKEQLAEIWITDKSNQNHLMFLDSVLLKNCQNGTRLYNNENIIPEGIYQIKTVNSGELNFTIDFPNDFDIEKQEADNRPELTSIIQFNSTKKTPKLSKDLMTEFLFLAKEATVEDTQIIIVPNDFRDDNFIPNCLTCPFWIEELYGSLRIYLNEFSSKTQ